MLGWTDPLSDQADVGGASKPDLRSHTLQEVVDEAASQRRWMVELAPGARSILRNSAHGGMWSPLWLMWLRVAGAQALEARERRAPDAVLDDLSARLSGVESGPASDHPEFAGAGELLAAMMAVVASALALDGFYGSAKPLVNPPKSKAARKRQIIEAFKLGFDIGGHAERWMSELDWLIDLRDRAVHHAEVEGPLVLIRQTCATDVLGSTESRDFTADSALRAANLAHEIIRTCLAHPKSLTREWVTYRWDAFASLPYPTADTLPPGRR